MSSVECPSTDTSVARPQPSSTSPPNSYVSLLDSSESPDALPPSFPRRATLNWTRTFGTLRQWSARTLKYTRQLFQERWGHVARTQDIELEQNIQHLRETKHRYEQILREASQMAMHFAAFLQTQRSFGELLNDLQRISGSSDDLVDQLVRNSQCQKTLAINGDLLLNSMKTFVDKLRTLISIVMEDTLLTIKAYEHARIEFDAYRSEYDLLLSRSTTDECTPPFSAPNEDIQRQYDYFKQRYERTKDDLIMKMKLLEDNRIHVLKQQLLDFHNALALYFSLNRQQLNL